MTSDEAGTASDLGQRDALGVIVHAVNLRLGGTHALRNIGARFPAGAISGLIGPNGAGKSTLLNCINGLYVPDSGSIKVGENEVAGVSATKIARLGIARTFQGVQLIASLSVVDNVLLGKYAALRGASLVGAILRSPKWRRLERAARGEAIDVLDKLGLRGTAHLPAGSLPYGVQKEIELARAMVQEPVCLLMDEPTAGLSREHRSGFIDLIRKVHDQTGLTMLIVEHNLKVIESLTTHLVVLDAGSVLAEGEPTSILSSDAVKKAYFGTDAAAVEKLA